MRAQLAAGELRSPGRGQKAIAYLTKSAPRFYERLRLLRLGGLDLRHARLHIAREVRDDAEETLDEHELAAVVHLVLLGAHEHLEARLVGRLHAGGILDALVERFVGK